AAGGLGTSEGGDGDGGGLYVWDGTVVLTTLTVDYNLAQGAGPIGGGSGELPGAYGDVGDGGGIFVAFGTVSLFNDTVQFNNAEGDNLGEGGGIYIEYGTVCLDALTVAQVINNTAARAYPAYPNIFGPYSICS